MRLKLVFNPNRIRIGTIFDGKGMATNNYRQQQSAPYSTSFGNTSLPPLPWYKHETGADQARISFDKNRHKSNLMRT